MPKARLWLASNWRSRRAKRKVETWIEVGMGWNREDCLSKMEFFHALTLRGSMRQHSRNLFLQMLVYIWRCFLYESSSWSTQRRAYCRVVGSFVWDPRFPLVASDILQKLLLDGVSLMFKTQESEEPQDLDRKLQLASMELVHHGPGV